ncbi:MAG: LPS assembly lipoprotein LptE [Kiritimatiellia bacterium]
MKSILKVVAPLLALAAGCRAYTWTPTVPQELRQVAVPTFHNESDVTELGNVVTRQVLREFQREGTYRIATAADCAIEIQGVLKNADQHVIAYARKTGMRNREYRLSVVAEVSFINKKTGQVLVDNRRYHAQTTFLANDDILTARRDASGRIAEELARQIVDDALTLK